MKRFLSIPLILFIGLIVFMFSNRVDDSKNNIEETMDFTMKDQEVSLEIADESDERSLGLMNRAYLEENSGMIFIYPDEVLRSFWMKNCDIPLDMIFIGKDKKVINVIKNAPICKVENCPLYPSAKPAMYVIEMNGGWTDKYGVKEGDLIEIP